MEVEFEAICGPKFMTFWVDVEDPLVVVNALDRLSISCSVQYMGPLNLPLSCDEKSVKKVVWAPDL